MIKRTDGTGNWVIVDATRDPFTNYMENQLYMNLSSGDYVDGQKYKFTDTGFEFLAGGSDVNGSGNDYIYMAFKGSYSDYVSPLNTDGDIDSRVKANTAKGFSIVSWEGNGSNSTIGHGLSSAPEFFFLKNRDTAVNDWIVYQSDVGATKFLRLNQTNATTTQTNIFNDTEPTSSVFTVGTNSAVNSSGVNYIAYCWHSVAGYSKFGSYTGTGSSGKAVTGLGFQPAFLMIKETSSTGNWVMLDNTRGPDNQMQGHYLWANLDSAEAGASAPLTFDSDGFTINSSDSDTNASGQTYIYMAFADTRDSQFNFDASGNKNNFTANNINSNASSETSYDIMTDVPTLTDENTANYCTWNPVDIYSTSYIPTYSDGNLKVSQGTRTYAWSTLGMSEGKWYAEIELDTHGSGIPTIGIALRNSSWTLKYTTYASNGNKIVNGSTTSYGSTYTAGDIIGIAFDADTGAVTFYKNNVSQGSISNSDLASNVAARIWTGHSGSTAANATWILNAGQQPFAYTPPDGFLPLNTYNLPDSTIVDGAEQFNTVLYTGNGSTQSITGVGFQPDLLWLKRRDSAENHGLHDVIRGSTNFHVSNQNANQYTAANSVTSFDSDGFSLGNYSNTNTSGSSMVAWNWKANGSGVSNTVGSINSTVSANTTAGFSIVEYTGNGSTSSGQTVGHGLGRTPEMIITKLQSGTQYNWSCWHKDLGGNYGIWLNLTNGRNSSMWTGYASHSSTVFVPADLAYNNVSGATYINYLWASIEGFSAFGSYTGNGSTDGLFIYTGFRPAFIILKAIDRTGHWTMFDSTRDTYNPTDHQLEPNYSSAEATSSAKGGDFLSNGWKCRSSETEVNQSGYLYLYMAFAENPFKNALAR